MPRVTPPSPATSSCLLPALCMEDQLRSLRQLKLRSFVLWVKLKRTADVTFDQWQWRLGAWHVIAVLTV